MSSRGTVCVRILEDASVEEVVSLRDRLPWRIVQEGTGRLNVDDLAREVAKRVTVKDIYPAGDDCPLADLDPDCLERQVHLHSIVGTHWSDGVLLQFCSPSLEQLRLWMTVNAAAETLIDWNKTRDFRHTPENVKGVLLLVAYTRSDDNGTPCHEYGAVSRECLQELQRWFPVLRFDDRLLAWMKSPSQPKPKVRPPPPLLNWLQELPNTQESETTSSTLQEGHALVQPSGSSCSDELKPDVPARETAERAGGKVYIPKGLPPFKPPSLTRQISPSSPPPDPWAEAAFNKDKGASRPVCDSTGERNSGASSSWCGPVSKSKSARPAKPTTQRITVYKLKSMYVGLTTAAEIHTLLSECDELEPHREFLQNRHFMSHYLDAHFFVRPKHYLEVLQSLLQELQPGDIIVSDCWLAAVEEVLTASGIDFFTEAQDVQVKVTHVA